MSNVAIVSPKEVAVEPTNLIAINKFLEDGYKFSNLQVSGHFVVLTKENN